MKDYQTPQKDQSRSSDLANRKSKESQLKKPLKIAKKSLNGAFSSASEESEITKESTDFSPIYNGDTEESAVPGLDLKLSPSSATSRIAVKKNEPLDDDSVDRCGFNKSDSSNIITVEAEIVANVLRQARSQVLNSVDVATQTKKLLDELIRTVIHEFYTLPEERDCLAELVCMRTHIVFLCFLLSILAVAVIFFFGAGVRSSSGGPLPT